MTSTFTATDVSLNVDGITPEAPLTAQLMDRLDRPMAGYEVTLTQNGLHQRIAWPKAIPANEEVALRLSFPADSGAKVYAIYLND
jgi:hypothetical protein